MSESSREVRLSIKPELALLDARPPVAGVVDTLRTGACFFLITGSGGGAGADIKGGDEGKIAEALLCEGDGCALSSGVPVASWSSSRFVALKELDRDVRLGRARAGLGLAASVDGVAGDLGVVVAGDLGAVVGGGDGLPPRTIGTDTFPATALGVGFGVTGVLVTATLLLGQSPSADLTAAKCAISSCTVFPFSW